MKKLRRTLSVVVTLLLWLAALTYFPTQCYRFSSAGPFHGSQLRNPYANCDFSGRLTANFHAHTRRWGGLTHGNVTEEALHTTYREMGYDVVGISDYMSINRTFTNDTGFIPIYEHGRNLRLVHQLVIGADHVTWQDPLLLQSADQKQDTINQIRHGQVLIALAHPTRDKAYTASDMGKLGNYDLIEVLNHGRSHERLWDAALSAGYPVFCLADDDFHITRRSDIGRSLTLLYTTNSTQRGILDALGQGHQAAVNLPPLQRAGRKPAEIRDCIKAIPQVKTLGVNDGAVSIAFDQPAGRIQFIRQGGAVAASEADKGQASYTFKPDDLYIRISALFTNGTEMLFNPVYRYDPSSPPGHTATTVPGKTLWFRIGLAAALAGATILLLRSRRAVA
jgi:hypothetical protein